MVTAFAATAPTTLSAASPATRRRSKSTPAMSAPVQWAMTRNNLGIAYRNRIKGNSAENQEQALACYTDALQVRTRETMPTDWAVTQNNLGRLYIDRIRGDRTENIEQAIASLRAALKCGRAKRCPTSGH